MTLDSDHENKRSAHLTFLGVDTEASRHLRNFWKLVEPALPAILEALYRHLAATPQLSELLGDEIERLKKAQTAHWERLFSARFDDAYFASVRTIGLAHNRIGLAPGWYIGGYTFVLNRLAALAITSYRWSPTRLRAVLTAVNKAVMLDMDVAISTYQEALLADRMERGRKIDILLQSFETTSGSVTEAFASAASELQAAARSLSGNAEQTTQQAANVAAAADQASVNVQTVASAAEELATSIAEISRQVAQSTEITIAAVQDAKRTDAVVQQLAESAEKIGEVVSLISDIAGQTNLLALNATIEAARAGDAGKGFAVVASEVKSLAAQTARATEDISHQIGQIQDATKNAVGSIQGIGGRIGEVSAIASAIAAGIEQQGAATREIARNVQQAAAGAHEVTANISRVSQGADDTVAEASRMLGAADSLSRQAGQLSAELDQFITGVKAA